MGDRIPAIVLFIALMMVFVALINPGANAAWSTFTNNLENPPPFPTFMNPFTSVADYLTLLPQANGSYAPSSTSGCPPSAWYQCLQSIGNPPTYDRLDGAGTTNFSFRLGASSGYAMNARVVFMQIDMVCRALDTTSYINDVGIYKSSSANFSGVYAFPGFSCNGAFAHQYINVTGDVGTVLWGYPATLSNFSAQYIKIFTGSIGRTDYAYFAITLGLSSERDCSLVAPGLLGFNQAACYLGQFAGTVINIFVLIGSGIVFVLTFIGASLVFIGSIIAGVLIGLFGSFAYFFAIPGMPTLLQGVIDAILIVCLLVVILGIADRAIGLFGGAVNKL